MINNEYKTLVQRLMKDDITNGDESVADAIIASDFYDHTNPPGMREGIEGHKAVVRLFRHSFADMQWEIEDMLVDENKVIIRTRMHGTHTGEFFGVAATGKHVSVSGIHVLRIANGKIAEHWGNNDDLGMMRQLGAIA
ncbi:MAG: ester cyclase [Anaerolineae bacterium]|nr:ester cyclase [Anaerolineae bacterium]